VTRGELIKMGHKNLNEVPAFYGGGIGDGNSVMSIDSGFQGMADPRNKGAAIGPSVVNEK
jgi:gamma-glutamyltranspeptidase